MKHVEMVGADFCQFGLITMSPRIARDRKAEGEEYVVHCSLCGVEYVGGESAYLVLNNFKMFDNCWACVACVEAIGFAQTVADLTDMQRLSREFEALPPMDRLARLRRMRVLEVS